MQSFNIGQLRRDQIDISTYSTNCNYKEDKYLNDESIVDFYDYLLKVDENPVVKTSSYYLSFDVKQMADSAQDFTIKLINYDDPEEKYQAVKTFSVLKGNGTTSFDVVFTPNETYNSILFELRRSAEDFRITNPDGTNGRKMTITTKELRSINDIINAYLKSKYSGLESLRKIGIQAPPGLMFSLNGEEMRVGRSGIFE